MEHYRWTREKIAFVVVVDSIGVRGTYPVLQTVGYEHTGYTTYTPRWLAQLMIMASSSVAKRFKSAVATHSGPLPTRLSIGHKSPLYSFLYQLTRYHLISSRYINDDGPFAWSGIPSTLFTNSIDVSCILDVYCKCFHVGSLTLSHCMNVSVCIQ